MFGKTQLERGLTWYEYGMFIRDKFRSTLSIVFGEVATHNHFVLDRGGKVFKQTAPVIKLPAEATEEDLLALLGLLNSSTACFWLKQVCQQKGSSGIGRGVYDEAWEKHFAFNSTTLESFPLPQGRPTGTAKILQELAERASSYRPSSMLPRWETRKTTPSDGIGASIKASQEQWNAIQEHMISLQEELDWECYLLYGLIDEDLTYGRQPPPLRFGWRTFEIAMQPKIASGEIQTSWFERHNAAPLSEPHPEWPQDYRKLVVRRMEVIETNRNIALIERPEYKRRWNTEPWADQLARARRSWLLDRLESYFDFDGRMNDAGTATARLGMALTSVARLADVARQDSEFQQVGEFYRDDPAFDIARLVAELVEAESVPLLPVLRYKPSSLRKRDEWEKTWRSTTGGRDRRAHEASQASS